MTGKLSLMETAAAMEFCRVVVANDSGLMHMATAVLRPVVALFGSTVREFGFYPYHSSAVVLERDGLHCRPCSHIGRAACPKRHFACLNDISPEQALDALDSFDTPNLNSCRMHGQIRSAGQLRYHRAAPRQQTIHNFFSVYSLFTGHRREKSRLTILLRAPCFSLHFLNETSFRHSSSLDQLHFHQRSFSMKIRKEDALEYHSMGRKGKIEVVTTKPCVTQRDLSLAYTPGVAEPCREIEKDVELAYEYTAKGNLVAVISNGTAVLGLGDIGPEAGKPVMEGKGVLFKVFADIDVFDIELDSKDIQEIIRTCQVLGPTFGGINLEDIKGPDCFYIEDELKRTMNIPVFHDDQHGTAIISGAALLNAVELGGKDISKLKVVYNGAGASGIACAKFHISLGVSKENVIMCDTGGRDLQGPHRAHERIQGGHGRGDRRAHARGSNERARTCFSASRKAAA
jgi:hypothetical protein